MHPRLNLAVQNRLFQATDRVFIFSIVNQIRNKIMDDLGVDFVLEKMTPVRGSLFGRGKRLGFDG
jgi:hypothetical protein